MNHMTKNRPAFTMLVAVTKVFWTMMLIPFGAVCLLWNLPSLVAQSENTVRILTAAYTLTAAVVLLWLLRKLTRKSRTI